MLHSFFNTYLYEEYGGHPYLLQAQILPFDHMGQTFPWELSTDTNLKGMLMLGLIIGDKHSLWALTPGQLRATSTMAEASIRPYPNLKSIFS